MKTFNKGIHLPYNKEKTRDKSIEELPVPRKVILPLQQHTGAVCDSLVKIGDEVFEGQKIGDISKFISAPVHASISGKVTRIERMLDPCGAEVVSVVIEASGNEIRKVEDPKIRKADDLSPEEIRKIIREAGMVGLGGAAFPAHVKLTPPEGSKIDTILINGCECEPYITADHRIMLERAKDVVFGAKIIARAAGARRIIFGVEDNKKDAVKTLRAEIRTQPEEGIYDGIEVVELEAKYPQGGEKMLIKAVLNREVPKGGLPLDIGVLVSNVGTAAAIAEAVKFGTPLIRRVLTVTGSGVKEPKNLLVRIGTTFEEIISFCGGLTEDAVKVVMGGPMMGVAVSTLEVPVVKATTCILVLNRREAKIYEEGNCIRCGRCIKSCPMGLMPNFIADYAKLKNWDQAEEYHVVDCMECGCCAYVCPSRIFLVQYFRVAKAELQMRKAICP